MNSEKTNSQCESKSSTTKPNLRKDAQENRERILSAAKVVFAQYGLGVTLDDIARQAGLGVATLYRRFPNKESLIEALFERQVMDVIDIARQALEFENAWQGFLFLVNGLLTLETEDRGLREVLLGNDYIKGRIINLKAEVGPLVETLVARAKAEGSLRPDFSANDIPVLTAMMGAAQEYCGSVTKGIWKRYAIFMLDGIKANRSDATPSPVDAPNHDELHQAMMKWKVARRQKSTSEQ